MTDLMDGAAALGRRIAAGEVDPADLAEAAIERIEAHPHGRRIFARLTPERARAEGEAASARARAGRRRGPLDGVPVSWKDLFDSAGVETASGSKLLEGRVPERDADVLAAATMAGTVCVGKTHMSELAFSGLGINPGTGTAPGAHGARLAPGGSSSGAAASVAQGLAAAAVGSDTGGSVRLPAAWNDLVGFRPSFGALSTRGAVPLVERLDTVGPLTRTVEDAGLMVEAMGGARAPDLRGADVSGARLAVLSTVAMEGLSREPKAAFEAACARLVQAGASVETVELAAAADAMELSTTIYAGEAWAIWGARIEAMPGAVWPPIEARIRGGEGLPAAAFIEAWRTLACLRADWRDAFAGFDAVITPTSPIVPPVVADLLADDAAYAAANLAALRNTRIGNLMDCAGLSLPTGAPSCGLQVLVPSGHDGRLLRLGAGMERVLA